MAPRNWSVGAHSHWRRPSSSARRTGRALLHLPPLPTVFFAYLLPTIFANENASDNAVAAVCGASAVRKLPGKGRRTRDLQAAAEGGHPAHSEDEFHSLRQVAWLIPAHVRSTYFKQVATLTLLSAHDSAQELESQPHCERLTHTYIHTSQAYDPVA